MQKLIGFAIIVFGLYLGYGVSFYYNRYSRSDALTERMASELADRGNYLGASYYHNSRHGPSWGKMFLSGLGCVACLAIGVGVYGGSKPPKEG